jgi:hypothetical protein
MKGDTFRRQLLSHLYLAASLPIGLLLFSTDSNQARNALYRARRRSLDPSLTNLQIRLLSEHELAICHPTPADEDAAQ